MDNYEYCVDTVERRCTRNSRILDYGCGAGQIVGKLRERGFNAYGCDVFYEGGSYANVVPNNLKGTYVLEMSDTKIPFEDRSIDFIVCNQVFEHVENLHITLVEIRRVLRLNGQILCMFPDKSVWREGHIGIPFVHWFPKGSQWQVIYAAALRGLGAGYHKDNSPSMYWAKRWCAWVNEWTYYRDYRDIKLTFEKVLGPMEHIEHEWLDRRFAKYKRVFGWWPTWLKRLVVVKLGGLIFLAPASSTPKRISGMG